MKRLQYEPRTRSNIVKDKEGRIVFDNEKVANRWKEYMEELYVGPEITFEDQYIENEEVDNNMKGPPIDDNEFNKALKELSDKKATGVDGIPAEILKSLDDKTKKSLFKFISSAYEHGSLLPDFIQSRTITIPKKGNATECSNYRTIALLSHASKILLNVVKNRLKIRIDAHLHEDQFGFRNQRGTREAILALRQILERRIDVNKDTYLAFVDLEKAFDKVDWSILFETLRNAGIDWKDRRFILNLYKSQSTIIDVKVVKRKQISDRVFAGDALCLLFCLICSLKWQ